VSKTPHMMGNCSGVGFCDSRVRAGGNLDLGFLAVPLNRRAKIVLEMQKAKCREGVVFSSACSTSTAGERGGGPHQEKEGRRKPVNPNEGRTKIFQQVLRFIH